MARETLEHVGVPTQERTPAQSHVQRYRVGVARCIELNSSNYIRASSVICIWVMNVCVFGPDCPIYIWNLLIYY